MRSLDAASAAVGESCWAAALHSESQCAETEEAVGSGRIPLVFVSEKRATSNRFKRLLAGLHEQEKLLAIAVDEAHLIYWWGKDFRAEYRNLGTLRDCVPGVPFLALTATAAPHVADDIASQLRLHEPLRARGSIYREHLHLARELRPSSAAGTQARVIELLCKRGTPATKPRGPGSCAGQTRAPTTERLFRPGRDDAETLALLDTMADAGVQVMQQTN